MMRAIHFGKVSSWLGLLTILTVVALAMPAPIAAQGEEPEEPSGEHEKGAEHAEKHGEEHEFHKNHFAVFVGFTEAVEEHAAGPHGETHSSGSSGGSDDPDFTIGLDYERRLTKLFGFGAMLDVVVEGRREFLLGPIAFLHPFGGAKFFAAPLWERVEESGDDEFVVRVGAAWDFEIGKYSLAPYAAYDMSEEHDIWVLGVAIGRGF